MKTILSHNFELSQGLQNFLLSMKSAKCMGYQHFVSDMFAATSVNGLFGKLGGNLHLEYKSYSAAVHVVRWNFFSDIKFLQPLHAKRLLKICSH